MLKAFTLVAAWHKPGDAAGARRDPASGFSDILILLPLDPATAFLLPKILMMGVAWRRPGDSAGAGREPAGTAAGGGPGARADQPRRQQHRRRALPRAAARPHRPPRQVRPSPSRPSCSTGHSAAAAYNDALTHLHRLASIAMVTSCGATVHKLDNLLRLQATGWQPSQVAILYAKSAAALHA